MASRSRLALVLALLATLAVGGSGVLLWQWKMPALLCRRIERLTGHHASVGGVTLNHRLDIVARDLRIAGASPFESQILARADRVTIRLRGPGGFWSPSDIFVDGLDVEYLGTAEGDNLRGVAAQKARTMVGDGMASSTGKGVPRIVVRGGRVHGSLALGRGPSVAFRIPRMEVERSPDGKIQASFHRLVADMEGLASLRASELRADYDRDGLRLASDRHLTVEIPGGGSLAQDLSLNAKVQGKEARIDIQGGLDKSHGLALTAHLRPQQVEVSLDAQSMPLRALGAIGANRALGLDNAQASLAASLAVDRGSLRARFGAQGKLSGIDVLHRAVDTVPWRNQDAAFDVRGHVDLTTGRISLDESTIKANAATLVLSGWIEATGTPRGSLTLSTPKQAPLPCAALLAGQPQPVKQALSGLELEGKIGVRVDLEFDANAWDNLSLDINVNPICAVTSEPRTLAGLLPILRDAKADPQGVTKLPIGSFHPDFVPLAYLPRHLPSAFLTSEDSKFFVHHGFDLEMIRHALAQDLGNGSFDRGASTITQQLAKNLFLTQRRTLARKLEEAVLTWRLQKLLSKDRVLELYLNVIELGPGIRGVKQAAHAYFGKDVTTLVPLESAHLAALTPNPHALARRFRDGEVDEGWQQRLFDLLGMMKRHGRLSPAELAEARTSRLVLHELSQDVAFRGAR